MPVTADSIDAAYRKQSATLSAHWQATERLLSARAELLKARAQKVGSGELDGRNEAEREARARALLPELFAAVEAAETAERRSALEAELSRLDISRIRTLMWFVSLSSGGGAVSAEQSLGP